MFASLKKGFEWFLFGNLLYGVSAVALALETTLQLQIPLKHPGFYLMLCFGTIAFYSFSYQYDHHPKPGNRRAEWIYNNRKTLFRLQWIYVFISASGGLWLYLSLPEISHRRTFEYFAVMGLFPGIAVLYYGIGFPGLFNIRLRQNGWLKPFIISLVWVGCIGVTPVVLQMWRFPQESIPVVPFVGFLLHNLMFITVLCVLFDIKDYAADHNCQLKTFVVRVGFRKTVLFIVFPLVLAGIASLLFFLEWQRYSTLGILLNLMPVFLLLFVTFQMHRYRSIQFFLVVIDGLMIVKASFGIAAALWA